MQEKDQALSHSPIQMMTFQNRGHSILITYAPSSTGLENAKIQTMDYDSSQSENMGIKLSDLIITLQSLEYHLKSIQKPSQIAGPWVTPTSAN